MKFCPYCGSEVKQYKEGVGIFICEHTFPKFPEQNLYLIFITAENVEVERITRLKIDAKVN